MGNRNIVASAGREFGHVPGHNYLDVDIVCNTRNLATLVITSGSSQGYDQEHGRTEYSRRGANQADAIENVRDEAMKSSDDDELNSYIETAASRALRMIYKQSI